MEILLISQEGRSRTKGLSQTRRILVLWLLPTLLFCNTLPVRANSPSLRRYAAEILALPPAQAGLRFPVELNGVVILSNAFGLVLHDGSAGIWVNWPSKPSFKTGDLLSVEGKIGRGGYSPEINATSIHKLGTGDFPTPKPVTYRDLSSGIEDAQYVTVRGVVRATEPSPDASHPGRGLLKLAMRDGFVDVFVPMSGASTLDQFLDAEVEIHAVALSAKNPSRQLTAAILETNRIASIRILSEPATLPFQAPLVPLGQVMQYRSGTDYYHRVHIVGTVTYYEPGKRLIVEDSGQAMLIMTTERLKLQFGDRVDASGFVSSEASGPILQDATIRLRGRGLPITPAKAHIGDLLAGALRYRLVIIEGKLVRRIDERSGIVFLVQDDSTLLQAELQGSQSNTTSGDLTDGAQVKVTGISVVDVEGQWDYVASVVRCKILMRSASDIEVTAPPSWWNTRRITYLAVILGVLILLLLALMIHSMVARWKLQLVMHERERMAHEIHDTMAQSFAGIGFQLQAILRAVPEHLNELRREVVLARDLVRHSHREARRSFLPTREDSEEPIDLQVEIEKSARSMIIGGKCSISMGVSETQIPVHPRIANELLRIAQEAIANAVRHADPTMLEIRLRFTKTAIRLEVEDNGAGFINSGHLIGFGLRGMRKRAASVGGRLEIFSKPGHGTTIVATAPTRDTKHLLFRAKAKMRSLFPIGDTKHISRE